MPTVCSMKNVQLLYLPYLDGDNRQLACSKMYCWTNLRNEIADHVSKYVDYTKLTRVYKIGKHLPMYKKLLNNRNNRNIYQFY